MNRKHFYTKHLNFARNMSKEVENNFKHVSIIANHRGCIMAVGLNRNKTHTLAAKLNYKFPFVHSELDAYAKLSYTDREQRLILFNYRFNKNGGIGLSAPCKFCLPWCSVVFESIHFSMENGEMGEL